MSFDQRNLLLLLFALVLGQNEENPSLRGIIDIHRLPLGQKPLGGQVAALVHRRVVLAVLGLDGVGGQEHGGLRWAVDLLQQDRLLHLQEEELAGDFLDQLLGHVLRVVLDPQLELQRNLLLHVLRHHLRGGEGGAPGKRKKKGLEEEEQEEDEQEEQDETLNPSMLQKKITH